jgi:hypothetical protein
MKKLIALILLGLMLLGLGACKPKTNDDQGQGSTTGQQQHNPLKTNTDDPFGEGN